MGPDSLPADVRAMCSLADPDYADVFTLFDEDLPTDAERFARAMFGDSPDGLQLLIWEDLLGLSISRERGARHIAGWHIGARTREAIRLEASSRSLTCNLVISTTGGTASLATIIRYERAPRSWVWMALSRVHRRLAPGLLREAAARVHRS